MLQFIKMGLELYIRDKRAVTALEYALVAAGIAAAVLAAFQGLGTSLSGKINLVAGDL
jgi:pilus assembly protein Flp/PilA